MLFCLKTLLLEIGLNYLVIERIVELKVNSSLSDKESPQTSDQKKLF